MTPAPLQNRTLTPRVLHAYLLGRVHFDDLLALQRRLAYEVAGDRSQAMLLLCEHPYGISVGRAGSAGHILFEPEELRARGWPVRWVNRGGGCLLSAPGQIAAYPIFALDRLQLNVQDYLDRLHHVLHAVLADLDVAAEIEPGRAGVCVAQRQVAHVGVAVRDWVSYYGFTLNVEPDLKPFRLVRCDGDERPMTSVERARRTRVRPATVRQRLLEALAGHFGFDRVSLFHHHPALVAKAPAHAAVTRLA